MKKSIQEIKELVMTNPQYEKVQKLIKEDKLCLLVISGSYAYGTETDDSDIDIRGVYYEDSNAILLGKAAKNKATIEGEADIVLYTFNNFMNMIRKNIPAALEMLGVCLDHIIYADHVGFKLISNKNNYLTLNCATPYIGYISQIKQNLSRNSNYIEYPVDIENVIKKQKKNQLHALRLYVTLIDILKNKTINTFRENIEDQNLFNKAKNGDFLNGLEPTEEFLQLINNFYNEVCKLESECILRPSEEVYADLNEFQCRTNAEIIIKDYFI